MKIAFAIGIQIQAEIDIESEISFAIGSSPRIWLRNQIPSELCLGIGTWTNIQITTTVEIEMEISLAHDGDVVGSDDDDGGDRWEIWWTLDGWIEWTSECQTKN